MIRSLLLLLMLSFGLVLFCSTEKQEGVSDMLPEIKGNLVFLYYKDLPKAQDFYENIMGFERVLDYGFATLHQASPTSFIGLVDETAGMHKTTEPKTVAIAIVSDQVDNWYEYMKGQDVELRSEVNSSSRLPIRGFTAYDTEGYLLEFETFLESDMNSDMRAHLAGQNRLYPTPDYKGNRPNDLGVQATVFWLYYNDLEEAELWYRDMLGLDVIIDQGFAKVMTSSATGFIGPVDQAKGMHKFSEEKSVTVSFICDDVEPWFKHFQSNGLEFRGDGLSEPDREPIRAFVSYDIGKYFVEFDMFKTDPRNERLLEILK